eukprot:COSAG06_NODE_151_length_21964_cov_95.963961_8_plen_96_part_00
MAKNLRTTYEAMAGRPDRHKMLMTDIDEATRQGTAASAQDTLFERTQWDFRLEDVSPGLQVLLWQGNYCHSMVQHQNGPKFPMKMDLFYGLTMDA